MQTKRSPEGPDNKHLDTSQTEEVLGVKSTAWKAGLTLAVAPGDITGTCVAGAGVGC